MLKYFTALYSCLFYTHYSLISQTFNSSSLAFIFFGTLYSYKLLQTSQLDIYYFVLCSISALFLPVEMMIHYGLIALITMFYPKYLRPHLILKPIAIGLSWSLLFKTHDIMLYIEAFFFIIALCLPFDLRDKSEDKDIKTLASEMNENSFKIFCILFWIIFLIINIYNNKNDKDLLVLGLLSFYYLVNLYSIKVNSSKFKTYIFLDFTIALQFFLVYLK